MNIEVLKFSASWCGPCKVLAQNLEGIEGITSIDIDKNMELAKEHNVRGVPMLVFKKNGKEVHRQVGLISKEQYAAILTEINDSKEI